MTPLITAAARKRSPELLNITGRDTSIAVAPAEAIGANGPNFLARNGEATSVNSSRNTFESRAIVPSSAASCAPRAICLYSDIRIDAAEDLLQVRVPADVHSDQEHQHIEHDLRQTSVREALRQNAQSPGDAAEGEHRKHRESPLHSAFFLNSSL